MTELTPALVEAFAKLEDVKKVRLEPGDVVIVRVHNEYVSEDSMTSITEALTAMFPDNRTLVLGPKITLEITQQPEAA